MKTIPNAGVSPFAHLAALAAGKKAEDETEEERKQREEKDDAAKKAEEDEKKKDDEAKRKAEEDEKKKDDEAKRAKKAEDGDDDDGDREDEEDPQARAARARERGRIRAIVLSPEGKANPVGAMHLATGTSMSRNQAVEMLAAIGAGAPPPAATRASDLLRDRMASVPNADVGGGEQPAPNLAQQIIAAGKKRRGEA